MEEVDKTDMQTSLTKCTRKICKWYIKLFFHLVDMSLYNVYALYKVNSGKKLQFVEFRKHVVEQIFDQYSTQVDRTASSSTVDNPTCLVGKNVYKKLLHKIRIIVRINIRSAFSITGSRDSRNRAEDTKKMPCL